MKIFVAGGHGFLAGYLLPVLEDSRHEIFAPTEEEFNIVGEDPYHYLNCGIFNAFDMVINLAAYTNVPGAEKNPEAAIRTNTSVRWLTELPDTCQAYHMSTDYVYDGNTPNSSEWSILKPFNKYGESKAIADNILLSCCRPNIHIIRTSFKPVKWPYPQAFMDVITNADTVDIIADMIATFMLANPPAGIYNIGTEPKTVYELAKRNNPDVFPCSVAGIDYLRPNVTMCLSKYHNFISGKNG
jgi:dTDP-4-dehydrorhamnose reductase